MLQEGRLKLGHLKNELCWLKPDWMAICLEAEHLLSPGTVLMPRASVGCPRLCLGPSKVVPGREWVGRGLGRGTYLHSRMLVDMGFAAGWQQLEKLEEPVAPLGYSSVRQPPALAWPLSLQGHQPVIWAG